MSRTLLPTLLLLAAALPGLAAPVEPGSQQARWFETRVRPVLATRCESCHGSRKQAGGLRLDSLAALLKGGSRGPAITAHQPERSLLVRAVGGKDPALRMPPGDPLPAGEVAALTEWVRAGAPWPATVAAKADPRSHWSLQPVRRPPLPSVKAKGWVRNPIDRFVLAELEANGLRPAPEADRVTLIRRVTFDLTGLPPTPEEVKAFVEDRSPGAWERVIDRLLASPAYGEKWGRHWLDVARYADSNGMDENVHYGNAWRYRDYVIASVNQDVPYDRFILEQLAGDLLPAADRPERHRNLIASGFLSIGPKLISEVDTRKMELDMIDEQVDTVGRTFLGMTLGCARCHDHKFDPISTEDYYGLAGIFRSIKTIEVTTKPRMWHEHSLASEEQEAAHKAHLARIDAAKQRQAKVKAAVKQKAPPKDLPDLATATPEQLAAEDRRLTDEIKALEAATPVLPAAMGPTEAEPTDLPVHVRGSYLELGKVVPRRFPAVLASDAGPLPKSGSGRLELARWIASPTHPLTGRVIVNRVWRWHFGRGIVPTPDNFGHLGTPPTHPELLDWLATWFTSPAASHVAAAGESIPSGGAGWRLKALHRLILTSSTYRMSDRYDAAAARKDPDNRLLWRREPQRLQAEEIRDSLLAVSGLLDRTMGGTLVTLKNREYFFDHTSKDTTRYDSRRRAVYLPVVRNHLYDFFRLYDFGDGAIPNGDRPTTTVATQALFMLNSDLIQEAAAALAASLINEAPGDELQRLRSAYFRLYGRSIRAAERDAALAFLADAARRQPEGRRSAEAVRERWSWLCHALLAANEFSFVR